MANYEHVDLLISGMGQLQENKIFRFLKYKKKSCFIPIENFFPDVHLVKDQMRKLNIF